MERELAPGYDALLENAASRARRYLLGIGDRAVVPGPEAVAALAALDAPLGDRPMDPQDVLALLDERASPATMATAGPRYFGFVNGGALPAAVAASWLTSAWDQNIALSVMSPAGAKLDHIALRLVVDALRLPEGTGGGFVGGATIANATCLAAARDAQLAAAGWSVAMQGLAGAPPLAVVVGGEVHASVRKALAFIGLGAPTIELPVDAQGRIVASDLPRLSGPAIVCLQAGNVNSGASDPFVPLIEWAQREGAWVHIDGAFGLWANACPALAEQTKGVERADSWATDGHKWPNTTYDCGIALVREAHVLRRSMEASAAYLVGHEAREPSHFTPQMSQRARGAEVWAVLRSLGREGLAEMIERMHRLAVRFADGVRAEGINVMNDVVLNQVVVDFGSAAATDRALERIQASGEFWAGGTVWKGIRAMRFSVSNWSTTEADIDRARRAVSDLV